MSYVFLVETTRKEIKSLVMPDGNSLGSTGMTQGVHDVFDASASALGYIFQIDYALFRALQIEDESENIGLEVLDDVAVLDNRNRPIELAQLKYYDTSSQLSNRSAQLWRTLRIWSTRVGRGEIEIEKTSLYLITSSQITDGSVASKLLEGKGRKELEAAQELLSIASLAPNVELKRAYHSVQLLGIDKLTRLLERVTIVPHSGAIDDVEKEIKRRLHLVARSNHQDLLFERLKGWWDKRCAALYSRSVPYISVRELWEKIQDLRDSLQRDALPIDFEGEDPEIDLDADDRLFMAQLRCLDLNQNRLVAAATYYYRAFSQITRWIKEGLVFYPEYNAYAKRLREEWSLQYGSLKDEMEMPDSSDEALQKQFGRKLLSRVVESHNTLLIRERVTEPYVMRGTYHILADEMPPTIWWHPNFSKIVTGRQQKSTQFPVDATE